MTTEISQQTINTVKSTAPVIKEHGKAMQRVAEVPSVERLHQEAITSRMYEIMFTTHPEVKSQFDMSAQANGTQPAKLATAVYAYATHIDDLGALKSAVDKIAHRHVATHVLPEQYPVVGECLLQAIKDTLGDAASPEVMTAWTEAYQALADIFINREQQIYQAG